jgi:hypothetical protein
VQGDYPFGSILFQPTFLLLCHFSSRMLSLIRLGCYSWARSDPGKTVENGVRKRGTRSHRQGQALPKSDSLHKAQCNTEMIFLRKRGLDSCFLVEVNGLLATSKPAPAGFAALCATISAPNCVASVPPIVAPVACGSTPHGESFQIRQGSEQGQPCSSPQLTNH